MLDDGHKKTRSPKHDLLNELESIKDLLNEQPSEVLVDELLDIPILNDIVPELSSHADRPTELLDLENIFAPPIERPKQPDTPQNDTPPTPSITEASTEQTIELDELIENLVDVFIPPIKAELVKRLSEYAPSAIHDLADKHLRN